MIKRFVSVLTDQEKARFKKLGAFLLFLLTAWFFCRIGVWYGSNTADHPVVLEKELQVLTVGSVEVFGVSNIAVPIEGATSSHTFTDGGYDGYSFSGSVDTVWFYSHGECDNQTGLEIEIAPNWKGSERPEICVHYGTYLAVSTLDNSHWDPEQNQLNGFPGQEWVQIKVERRPPPTATPQPTSTPTSEPAAESTSQSN